MKADLSNPVKWIAQAFILLISFNLTAYAQKTDDVQTSNLLVSNIKIDGKVQEWPVPLKANNKNTGLAYSIANDNKNLYVVIQSTDINNNRKVLLGGITLSINPDGKKKVKDAYSITYPVVTSASRRQTFTAGRDGRTPGQPGGNSQFQQRTPEQRDSMQLAQGKLQLASAKDIKVSGFKSITDSLISIYNEYGIKASATFDDKGVFTYEIAVPLEALSLSASNPKEFSYNISVNGLQMNGLGRDESGRSASGNTGGFGGGGSGRSGTTGSGSGGGGGFGTPGGAGSTRNGIDFQALTSPTDFWGKYTLAN